ncbi:MAG: saccharopine dehydrogenase [Candidatus Nanopelagicales bacterium]
MTGLHLWLRAEARPTEQRAPLVPADAAALVARGIPITVEDSPTRAFPVQDYLAAGCTIVPAGSWPDAPEDAVIVGIKELPGEPWALRHTHVYFAHAFKGQAGSTDLLARFADGGGELLDIEYLTEGGRRVVAFGYWAGYVGAGLGALVTRDGLDDAVQPGTREDFDAALSDPDVAPLRALVIGALGRSGRGAIDALAVAGAQVTGWDLEHTVDLDRAAILDHDLLVNCVASTVPMEPFLRAADLELADRRLRTVADVTCDVTSAHNLLPINTAVTTWAQPVRVVHDGGRPVSVIAIDNLPSLLPRESSVDFSADLTALLQELPHRRGAWAAAEQAFRRAVGGGAPGDAM